MARPTYAQAETMLKDLVRTGHDGMIANWTGIIAQIRTALGNLQVDEPRAIGAGIRNAMDQAWASHRTEGLSVLNDIGRSSAVNFVASGTQPILKEFFAWYRDYLADEGKFAGGSVDKYVTSRDWTRGSITSPTGTKVYSTYTDKRGFGRQNGHPDTYEIKVTSSGSDRVKVIEIKGLPRGREPFEYLGSGAFLRITLFDVNNEKGGGTTQLLKNPCLLADTTTDAASVTSISGWTLPGTVDWNIESAANLFGRQVSVLESAGTTVANHTLTQALNQAISSVNPFCVGFWARNHGSFEGAMQIAWGDVSQSWTHSSFDSTNWTAFVADFDKDLFVQNFDEDDCDVVFSLPTMTTGTMTLGSVFMIEMVEAAQTGRHFAGLAGDTGPLHEAFGTAADSIGGSEGDYSEYIAKAYDDYLTPSGSNQIAEPT